MPTEALATNVVVQPYVESARESGTGREEGAGLTDHRGERGDDRAAHRPEPGRDQPEHADEHHRVAHAHEDARDEGAGVGPGVGEPELGHGHEHRARDQQPLRPEPVEQDPDGDLHRGVHQQLEHRERRELRRRDVEALGRDEAGDAERGAVEDRQEVDRDGGAPDDQRALAAQPDGLARCDSRARRDRPLEMVAAPRRRTRPRSSPRSVLEDPHVLVDRRLHPVGPAAHHHRGEQRLALPQRPVDRREHARCRRRPRSARGTAGRRP